MLHYRGDELALELGEAAKFYIQLYEKKGENFCKVAFFDIQKGRKRFVKFEKMGGINDWVFTDITD